MGPSLERSESCAGMTDLKKLFSHHFQENIILQRQRTDLDYAKSKKLKELSHTENLFMRKYEKYVMPTKKRRGSIDANVLRTAEFNTSRPSSRVDEAISTQKTLGRMAISSDCPYSMDAWNMMVNVDKNFLEENKNTILHTDDRLQAEKQGEESQPETPRAVVVASPLLPNRDRITKTVAARKNMLTPLEEKINKIDVEDDTIDEELVSIQMRRSSMPRRHSINPVSGCGLPRIQNRRGSIDSTMVQPPQNRAGLLSPLQFNSKSDPELFDNAEENLSKSKSTSNLSTLLKSKSNSSINLNKKTDTKSCNKKKSILKKAENDFERPVATATIFVRGDDGESKRIYNSDSEDNENSDTKTTTAGADKSDILRFPDITKNPCITVSQTDRSDCKCSKSVSFNFNDMRSRSGSDASVISKKSSEGMRQRTGSDASTITSEKSAVTKKPQRRHSMSTAALKLMVDSQHGASKLRYLALLAREMEKEAKRGIPDEETEKPFSDIQNCRYLRVVKDGESEY